MRYETPFESPRLDDIDNNHCGTSRARFPFYALHVTRYCRWRPVFSVALSCIRHRGIAARMAVLRPTLRHDVDYHSADVAYACVYVGIDWCHLAFYLVKYYCQIGVNWLLFTKFNTI